MKKNRATDPKIWGHLESKKDGPRPEVQNWSAIPARVHVQVPFNFTTTPAALCAESHTPRIPECPRAVNPHVFLTARSGR